MSDDIDEALRLARETIDQDASDDPPSDDDVIIARAVLEMHAEIERLHALDPNDDSLSDADHYRAHVMRQAQALCSLNRDRDRLREALSESLAAEERWTQQYIRQVDPDWPAGPKALERIATLRKEFGL